MRALLVVGVLLALCSVAVADKARADKLFEEGRGYLQRKEYALACTAFEQSYQADPAIGTQLNIALCYEQWGKLAAAHTAYLEAERLAKAKKDDRQKHSRRKVDELEPKLARLRIAIPPGADPYAIYLFDGKETEREDLIEERLLDAGKHTIEVRLAGNPPKTTVILLKPGERKQINLDLPTQVPSNNGGGSSGGGTGTTTSPRKAGKLYGGIALMVGGGAAIGIASYVALIARSDYNDAIAMCPDNQCLDRSSYLATMDARTRANQMSFVAGAGVVMLGVGVVLVLTSKGAPPARGLDLLVKTEKVSARPLLAPNLVGVAIGGSL